MKRRFSLFPWRSRSEISRDVDNELAFHLEMRTAELVRDGLDPASARARATVEFGDIEFTRAYCRGLDSRADRATRIADRVASWRQDLQYAWRSLRRAPGFAAVSLVTLALAIGANTAIFSVTRAVLIKPLPFGDPDALVMMTENWPGRPGARTPTSPPNFVDYRAQQHTFTDIAAMGRPRSATWRPDVGDPVDVKSLPVTASFFSVLQVQPILGHTFVSGDDTPGNDLKTVISYRFWRSSLGGDPQAAGRRITLNGRQYEVIGVMPAGFTFGYDEEMWLPLDLSDELARAETTRKQHWIHPVGRLKPGVSIDAALADLQTISHRLALQYPQADSARLALLQPLRDVMAGELSKALLLLFGGAGLVLLIACANLANLTLARTSGRRREMAVRAALGAGRGRLVRQLLLESLLLAGVGGAIGVGVGAIATRVLLALNPSAVPSMFTIGIDARVLLFSAALSIGTGILFGLVPAFDAARADLNASLRDGGRSASGGRAGTRARRSLVIAQIGLAVVLLVGAGLLLRSFAELTRVRLGFDPSHVLTAQFRATGDRYDSTAAVNRLFDGMIDGVRRSPGIIAVGGATYLPTQGRVGTALRIDGAPTNEGSLPDLGYVAIRGDYFKAMGIRLKAGREYSVADAEGAPKVAIINETAARRFFPRGDAIGRRIRIGPNPNGTPMEIIGIVGDLRDERIDVATEPMLYANHRQEAWDVSLTIVARTAGDPVGAIGAFRRSARAADPSLALREIKSLESVVGSSLASRRFALGLIWCFAAVALALAAIGIYGVLAYMVSSRTRELGIRLALGATAGSVLTLVVRQGVVWALIGLALGIAGAAAAAQLLAGSLYNVTPLDTLTYVAVATSLLVVVIVACMIPGARATRVDPIASMRAE